MLAMIGKELGPRYAAYVAGESRKSEFSALAPFPPILPLTLVQLRLLHYQW